MRGGAGRRYKGVLQTGNIVAAHWRGRLAEHLGTYSVELERAFASTLLDDPDRLACLASACALAEKALPERHPCAALFDALGVLLDSLGSGRSNWDAVYVLWELGLLDVLGFGLDLRVCAVTGNRGDLAWISPRSGRAVSAEAGEPYRERLLALPEFLTGGDLCDRRDICAGLHLTGHFLAHHVFDDEARGLPPARGTVRPPDESTVNDIWW